MRAATLLLACGTALIAPSCSLAQTPGEISAMSATMQDMAGEIEVMSASLVRTNDSLGTTNSSLGDTNEGLDGMDGRLAAMTAQLEGLAGAMGGMRADLGTMVGQMEGLGAGMEGMRAAMEETNRLLVEVLNGINATSAGLAAMGKQLDGLPPRILAEAQPLAERAGAWLVPALLALLPAWATLAVLLWRILGALSGRAGAAAPTDADGLRQYS